jgi:hypothetical protein
MTPSELIDLLSGPTLTIRTGLWLVPLHVLGKEQDTAARLGIDAADLRVPIISSLPAGTRFLGLSTLTLVEALDAVCSQSRGSNCLLVYNLDLLLARLPRQERLDFWQFMFKSFPHRQRGLLLLMPQLANSLLPQQQMQDVWRRDGRLVVEPATR